MGRVTRNAKVSMNFLAVTKTGCINFITEFLTNGIYFQTMRLYTYLCFPINKNLNDKLGR